MVVASSGMGETRELLDTIADYVEARAAERGWGDHFLGLPPNDLDGLAAKFEELLRAVADHND